MKKVLTGCLIISTFLIASCVKKASTCAYSVSGVIAPSAEIDSLKTLLADSGIVGTQQNDAGFLYKIDTAGTGTSIVNLCSTVTVAYKASFFNGTQFDSTITGQFTSFQLGQVIVGWQKGLPLINSGGAITLYIPPSLAYGPNAVTDNLGNIIIPANSYLIFHVYLADVQ